MSKCSAAGKNLKGRRILPFVVLSAFLLSFSGSFEFVYAADDASNLAKLEDKYFQHAFPKDETADRIERLEKLIFGEARSGSNEQRLKSLTDLVPDLNSPPPTADTAPAESPPERSSAAPRQALKPALPQEDKSVDEPPVNDSSYPAVTAMEKKLLARDYIGEAVGKRLDRLEIKAFGKTSASDDLQDRVDRLKSATGIDIAKVKPANSEWADEEEDSDGGVQPFTGISSDDPSSQRNLRKQQAYNRPRSQNDPYAGTGTFGSSSTSGNGNYSGTFGAGSAGSSGSYGSSGRFADGMPPSAPDYSRASASPPVPAPQLGVSQQIALLEKEVFGKTYEKEKQETILTRLSRLESTVFPQDKPAANKSLPDRMSRLLAAVPLSQAALPPTAPSAKRRRGGDPDYPDLDFDGPSNLSSQQRSAGGGGLSKIINGLGNALSGGYAGSYNAVPGTVGTLVTDPSTGLLYDQYTGTLIDPMTGAVVGRRSVQQMGGYGYPAYGGFNSGLSPMSPFGGMGGSGMNFGFGGGGIRFGGWP
ncbi:MAG: hypothetical protein K2X27_16725 [Candidatus Obscuribacterales bacterium]|nr:hypothetical protein [Candidatus Obscuribacterales bacterium]